MPHPVYVENSAHIFEKFWSHLKILGTSRVTQIMFHTEDTQVLGLTLTNFVIIYIISDNEESSPLGCYAVW